MTGPQQPPPHPQHHQMVQMLQTPQGNIPLIFPQHFPKVSPLTKTHKGQINFFVRSTDFEQL